MDSIYTDVARQVDDPDVHIPRNVTLMMAPGAVLQLAAGVVVRIDGELDAPIAQIFQYLQPAGTPDDASAQRFGRVVFFSDSVPTLYPEWWGACHGIVDRASTVDDLPVPSADAIARYLHAAHRDRVWSAWAKHSIPVSLQGRYRLEREVRVDDQSGPGVRMGFYERRVDKRMNETRAVSARRGRGLLAEFPPLRRLG